MKKKQVLVLNTTHIGTTLCDFPLIGRVCKKFNEDEVTVVLARRNGVLKPYIEKAFGCRVEILNTNFTGFDRYKIIWSKFKNEWNRFDIGICGLEPRKTDHLLLWVMCKDVIAYVENNWHGKLISRPVKYVKEVTKHRAEKALEVFSQKKLDPTEWPLLPRPEPQKGGGRFLVSMQNNRESCTLNNENLAAILMDIHKYKDFTLVINDVGQVSDKTRDLIKRLPNFKIECVPTANFSDFVDLVGSCDCCLLGEGGTSHVAGWQRVPQVVLFGQEEPSEWRPLTDNAICLQYLSDVNKIEHSKIVNAVRKIMMEC